MTDRVRLDQQFVDVGYDAYAAAWLEARYPTEPVLPTPHEPGTPWRISATR